MQTFIQQKKFVIHTSDAYREMPIFISAAAIQITFGLQNFLLPYFTWIQIKPTEYFANDNSFRVLAGHVVENSITIAFNHMVKGFENDSDGQNVALHEMAHALYFQKVEVDLKREKYFQEIFEKILQEGKDLYAEKNKNILYTENAFINLQEFWAESVELFFEKPIQLKIFNEELFNLLCSILKQNPINSSNPLLA